MTNDLGSTSDKNSWPSKEEKRKEEKTHVQGYDVTTTNFVAAKQLVYHFVNMIDEMILLDIWQLIHQFVEFLN